MVAVDRAAAVEALASALVLVRALKGVSVAALAMRVLVHGALLAAGVVVRVWVRLLALTVARGEGAGALRAVVLVGVVVCAVRVPLRAELLPGVRVQVVALLEVLCALRAEVTVASVGVRVLLTLTVARGERAGALEAVVGVGVVVCAVRVPLRAELLARVRVQVVALLEVLCALRAEVTVAGVGVRVLLTLTVARGERAGALEAVVGVGVVVCAVRVPLRAELLARVRVQVVALLEVLCALRAEVTVAGVGVRVLLTLTVARGERAGALKAVVLVGVVVCAVRVLLGAELLAGVRVQVVALLEVLCALRAQVAVASVGVRVLLTLALASVEVAELTRAVLLLAVAAASVLALRTLLEVVVLAVLTLEVLARVLAVLALEVLAGVLVV